MDNGLWRSRKQTTSFNRIGVIMNFNMKDWNFANWIAFFISVCTIQNFAIGFVFGYVFASTFGELIHNVSSKKGNEAFAKKHNLVYNPKTKQFEKRN